jgi:hypothetical protein
MSSSADAYFNSKLCESEHLRMRTSALLFTTIPENPVIPAVFPPENSIFRLFQGA